MSKLPVASLFKIIFETKSSVRFLIGTIGSFAFSMAVILCTLGLMDGFVFSLKESLSHSNGDLKITSRKGFYNLPQSQIDKLTQKHKDTITPIFQVESFVVIDNISKGVLVKGVERKSFSQVTGLDFKTLKDGVFIGKEFSSKFNVNLGDELTLILPRNPNSNLGDVVLEKFEVEGVIAHGIYEKDMRFVYLDKDVLTEKLGYVEKATNMSLIKSTHPQGVEAALDFYKKGLAQSFQVEPFWSESEVLLDAVEVEKYSISLVLQLIVIVSILNVVAFIIFISEIKSQDFFMLRALGVSVNLLQRFWLCLLVLLWALSCGVSFVLMKLFSFGIENLPLFKIPGDIYVLSELKIILNREDYIYVFAISLVWILLIGFITMFRLKNKSVLSGLREEFS